MAVSRKHAVVAVGAVSLALVACDSLLGLGNYQDVPPDGGHESSTIPMMDASEAGIAVESGMDADAGGGDADADVVASDVTMPEGGWPLPTAHELWAHWPMPNPDAAIGPESSTALPHAMTYDAGADGGGTVVTDVVTKLVWWRQFRPATTYDAAWGACYYGLGNAWRLPTRIELVSLVDFTRTPTLDTNTFLDAGGAPTWTSSAVPGDGGPSAYWVVDFSTGLTGYGVAGSQVICVSGGDAQ